MNRLLFFSLFVLLFLGVDYYLFQAVRSLTRGWQPTSQRWVMWLYWAIPVFSLVVILLGFFIYPSLLSYRARNLLAATIFILYISKLVAIPLLLLDDVGRLGRWLLSFFQKPAEPVAADAAVAVADTGNKISRSDFISQAALAVGGLHLGAMTWGILSGAHEYRIRRVVVPIKDLPRQFDGIRIGQLSDIHSGSFFNKTAVVGGVEMLQKEKPDVVFFTGDLVNNEATELVDYVPIFGKIKAPLGVYSVLGNHDYGDYKQWESEAAKVKNLQDLKKAHADMGWNLLLDEHKPLQVDGEQIGVLGIQNWGMAGFTQYGDLKKTLERTDDYATKLLLSHDPSHWRAQVLGKTNIDVAFAGHTHGMQYGVEIGSFKWSPVQYRYKEWAGLYTEGNQHLYVNRGFGFIGYPGRVGILPEITIMELKRV